MTEIVPALSATEWTGVLAQQHGLTHLREQFGTLPFSTHAIAALLLYEEPFGFTRQDVQDEKEVSDYCAVAVTASARRRSPRCFPPPSAAGPPWAPRRPRDGSRRGRRSRYSRGAF